MPTREDAIALGLTGPEYLEICEKMGGPPNEVELAMFSLMWSEHCAYKHSRKLLRTLPTAGPRVVTGPGAHRPYKRSRKLLRTLPTEGPRVVMGPGENAGAVDVGDGLVCAFKVESHNHPSAVEPFQGAAAGAGGILRGVSARG